MCRRGSSRRRLNVPPHRIDRGRVVVRHAVILRPNAIARSNVFDDSRTVGTLYAYDNWTVTPRLAINYGAKRPL